MATRTTSPAVFLTTSLLLILIDAPWLYLNSASSVRWITSIQGGVRPAFRLWPAIPVYLALAYLLLQTTSVTQAFLYGVATYAVYDFTMLAVFRDYPLFTACSDALWGGVLFALTYSLMKATGLR
jgi:uncharacterized membrane protein